MTWEIDNIIESVTSVKVTDLRVTAVNIGLLSMLVRTLSRPSSEFARSRSGLLGPQLTGY